MYGDSVKRRSWELAIFHQHSWQCFAWKVELVSKELNHLAAILHVYAGGLNFMK